MYDSPISTNFFRFYEMIRSLKNFSKPSQLIVLFLLWGTSILSQADDNLSQNKQPSTGGFAIYGNWCGPNHPADINNAPDPVDLLDKQCQTHDLCYVEKGDFDCGCDRQMVKNIDYAQHQRLYTREQNILAQNIKLHFAISPCNGEVDGNKILPTRILTRVYKGTKRRVLNTYDRFIGRHLPDQKDNTTTDNIVDDAETDNKTE